MRCRLSLLNDLTAVAAALVSCICGAPTAQADEPGGYILVDLSADADQEYGRANDINNSSQAVGTDGYYAILWERIDAKWVATALPDGFPLCLYEANAINDASVAIGYAKCINDPFQYQAWVWQPGQDAEVIVFGGIANDVSDVRKVVGQAFFLNPGAFLWENGFYTYLDVAGAAFAIKDSPGIQIVGFNAFGRAMLWERIGFNWSVTDLGTLGGPTSEAHDISDNPDSTQIIGWADTEQELSHAFLWQDEVMIDLGTLGGSESFAYAIRTKPVQIVGSAMTADEVEHAFIYHDGVMYDLNDLVVSGPPMVLAQARGINDNLGQIVGQGQTPEGEWHAFVLTPIVAGDLNGDGTVGILDLLILLGSWGPCPDPPEPCPADLDDDSEVGIFDLLALLANWG